VQIYDAKSKCYGCGKCMVECPVGAIQMQRDEEGFLYPVVDVEKCVHCGRCKEGCIINLTDTKNLEIKDVYACTIKDKTILSNSTSGGIFYLLAENILKEKGVVYGAAYGEGLHVQHIRLENLEDIYQLQGSKYVQSDITDVLNDVQKDIEKGRKVLFSGTPCQIAAVRYLIGENDALICMEIACMGCPSPLVWEKYISNCEEKWGTIFDVKFRDKCSGWNGSSISYVCKDEKKSFRHYTDIYMEGFGQGLFYRPSCHKCSFKGKNSFGDLKIGDFWGIQNYDETYKGVNGVSVVIIETKRGQKIFDSIQDKMDVKLFPYKLALTYNEYFELSKQPSKNRNYFFRDFFKGEKAIDKLIYDNLYPKLSEKELYWCRYPVVENLLKLTLEDDGILSFFQKNHYDNIVIYGLGDLGILLLKILKKTGINVTYLMDRNFRRFPEYLEGVRVVGLHQITEISYDCIIVTAICSYNNILELLMVQDVDISKVISIGSIV